MIHFFRSFISFLRSFISFLRRIFYSPRGDFEISTWKSLFPDMVLFRYVVGSKLLQRAGVEFAQPGTVAKVNSLTILLARLSRLCRKDEAQGAEGEVWREHTSVCDRSRIPKATQRFAFMQQSHYIMRSFTSLYSLSIVVCGSWKIRLRCVTLGWEKLMRARYNNLELTTHRNGAASGKSDFHVDISKSPRGE